MNYDVDSLLAHSIIDLLDKSNPPDAFHRYGELFIWKKDLERERGRIKSATYADEARREDRLAKMDSKLAEILSHLDHCPPTDKASQPRPEISKELASTASAEDWETPIVEPAPANSKPKPLHTKQIAQAFDGVHWDFAQWKRNLADFPKWLKPALANRGRRGKRQSTWNPVELAK